MNYKILNISNIIEDLNSKGFFESEKLINVNDLNNLRSLVNKKIKQIGNQNFWLSLESVSLLFLWMDKQGAKLFVAFNY